MKSLRNAAATAWPGVLALVLATVIVYSLRESIGHASERIMHAWLPLLLLVPYRALPLALDALGWWILLARTVPYRFVWWTATVRDGVSRLLPVASVGGEVVGVRLACWRLRDSSAVIASVIVEVLVTLGMQAIFALFGIAALAHSVALHRALWPLGAASAATLAVLAACAWWLRRGAPFDVLMALARRVLGHSPLLRAGHSRRLDAALRALAQRPRAWLAALAWQLAGQAAGAIENFFALWVMGVPVTFSDAVAIEAVAQIARHVAFFVPLGVGVQDAAIVLTSQLAGIGTEAALSLALVKRMREVLSGGLALASWLVAERVRRAGGPRELVDVTPSRSKNTATLETETYPNER
ncbi:hypothetical protein BURK_008761 [Burkholderia sp. SJ98]|uniref:lysylphosphatidylglycerol synthase domain-containing protein n=1 Tax=Caballeronia zhejiangensis TaxID=871203 RepID=UPI00025B9D1B|nr:lysylphosphatidylglycerol synthase domain-containing protein [Caballeronia zhejiangensis]EKS71913.1 hypothetical protein BURK_008761 [Burkholderia sp. SJ98]